MTQSVAADPGQAVLTALDDLVERHRDQGVSPEELPTLLDELGAVLRRARSAVRRAARRSTEASTAPAPAVPPAQPAPQPPAKHTTPAPVPSPTAEQTTGARGDSPRDQADQGTDRRRGGSRLLGVIAVVGLVILAGLVLLLAGSAFGMELGAGRCVAPTKVASCGWTGPPGAGQ